MVRVPRFRRPRGAVLAVIVTAALAFPLGVLASHQYPDVPDSNPFHDDIAAITDAGVTTGCGGGNYCPSAFVTREQMAAFMSRLGALRAGQTPVANANTSRSTDGWSLGCPANTVLSGGLCFDTSTRASGDVFDSAKFCADLGGGFFGRGQLWRLPQALELRSAHVNGDITISAAEWSSTVFHNGTTFHGFAVNGTALVDSITTASRPFRCAAIPSGRDPLIIIPLDKPQDGSDAGKTSTQTGTTKANGSVGK